MPLVTPPIKNISEVTEPLKEQILKGDVHTIDEMRAWLKPLGYSDTINEAAVNSILREFVMSKVSSDSMMNMDMVVNILRPQLEHQISYFSHQPSLRFPIIETCKQAGIMVKDYQTYVLSEQNRNRGNKDYASLISSKVVLK